MVLRAARWVRGRAFGYQSLTGGPDSVAMMPHQPLPRCSTSGVERLHLRCLVIVVLAQEWSDRPLVLGALCPGSSLALHYESCSVSLLHRKPTFRQIDP